MGTAEYKMEARAALHEALANPAVYTRSAVTVPSQEQLDAGLALTVRWHNRNRTRILGERTNDDAGIVEGINRLVFNTDELDALGLVPERNAVVEVPGLGKSFRLDYREESDGPLNVYWSVIEL
ncbi:MAG TPA: hypothetical protein VK181_22685 [Rhizobium sp.]|nr:hypothetical protein [Rhizobium sp.]